MIRVASYCRVSTDREDQANSFESQQRYFKEYIRRQPDWELYEVYADEGVTGTSTKKRAAFHRMMHDACSGCFRLILTKEVSRFSRNILDTIACTRELRRYGVGVLFMNDGINTLDPDAELRLSIMASIAQEESRRTSSRVKWGQTRRMEQGVVFGRSLLGYDVKDGEIAVNPEGAEIVKQIFYKYGIEKKGTTTIARELQEAGYKTRRGTAEWSNSHIVKILKNEKYAGDLVQKKTYTPDYLSHTRKYNHGEEELVILPDHHEAIISRELWELVQSELKRRNRRSGSGHSNRYLFSGKIRCGECGASFVSRTKKRKNGVSCKRWGCYTAVTKGSGQTYGGCRIGWTLRDDLALELLKQAIKTLQVNWAEIAAQTAAAIQTVVCLEGEQKTDSISLLTHELDRLTEKKEAVLDAFFSGSISEADMKRMNERYNREQDTLQIRLQAVKRQPKTTRTQELKERIFDIVNGLTESEAFYKNLLDRLVVFRNGRVEASLNGLSQVWTFQVESNRKKRGPV